MTEVPLTAAAVVFLIAYSWQVLAQPPAEVDFWLQVVEWATWGLFVVDYAVRLKLADGEAAGSFTTCWIWPWWRCRSCVPCGCYAS